MIYGYSVLLLVQLVVLVYCALDIVRTPADQVRGRLPKPLWLVLVVLFPLVGGAGWFLAGRPRTAVVRPQRAPLPPPDDDEDFLRELRRRADEQRRRSREGEDPTPPPV